MREYSNHFKMLYSSARRVVLASALRNKPIYVNLRHALDLEKEVREMKRYRRFIFLPKQTLYPMRAHELFDSYFKESTELKPKKIFNTALEALVSELSFRIDEFFDAWVIFDNYYPNKHKRQLPLSQEIVQIPGYIFPESELTLNNYQILGVGRSIGDFPAPEKTCLGMPAHQAFSEALLAAQINAIVPEAAVEPAWITKLIDAQKFVQVGRKFDFIRLAQELTDSARNFSNDAQRNSEIKRGMARQIVQRLGQLNAFGFYMRCIKPHLIARDGRIINSLEMICHVPNSYAPNVICANGLRNTAAERIIRRLKIQTKVNRHDWSKILKSSSDTISSKELPTKLQKILLWPEKVAKKDSWQQIYLKEYFRALSFRLGYYETTDQALNILIKKWAKIFFVNRTQKDSFAKILAKSRTQKSWHIIANLWQSENKALPTSIAKANKGFFSPLLFKYNSRLPKAITANGANLICSHPSASYIFSKFLAESRYCNRAPHDAEFKFSINADQILMSHKMQGELSELMRYFKLELGVVRNQGGLKRSYFELRPKALGLWGSKISFHTPAEFIIESLRFSKKNYNYLQPIGPYYLRA